MTTCYKCNRELPAWFGWTLGDPVPESAWHMTNPAPHAAAQIGPTILVPVCNRCEPVPWSLSASTVIVQPSEKFKFYVLERAAEIMAIWLARFRTGDPCDEAVPMENERLMAGHLVGALSANNLLVTEIPVEKRR